MLARILIYCRERRVLALFVVGLVVGLAATGTSLILHGLGDAVIDFKGVTILAAFTSAFFFVYARLQDEVKDLPVDAKFFPNTPLAAGRVKAGDVTAFKWFVIGLIVAINAYWGDAFVFCLVVLAIFVITEHEFFIPSVIESNRLYAFISHTPSWWVLSLYLVYLFSERDLQYLFSASNIYLCTWITLPLLILEVARKTWSPDKELDGYQTYSSLLGFRWAAVFALTLIFIHLLITFKNMDLWQLSSVFLLALCANAFLVLVKSIQFIKQPANNEISGLSEVYLITSFLGLAINSLMVNAALFR